MKNVLVIALIATLTLITANASAVIIERYYGQVTYNGVPLEAPVMGPNYDYESIGNNPLIQLFLNGVLVDETTVGVGIYIQPANGEFVRLNPGIDANPGDILSCVAYVGPTATGPSGFAEAIVKAQSTPPMPTDYQYDFGVIEIIPEPSIALVGLILFMFKKKK